MDNSKWTVTEVKPDRNSNYNTSKKKNNIDDKWTVTEITQEKVRDYSISELSEVSINEMAKANDNKVYELTSCKLRLARTLFNNFYRARIQDGNGEDVGQILIVPGLPLERSELPDNAPIGDPYLVVIVEDAKINKNSIIDFEEGVSRAVLARFTTETNSFNHCEFYYPSPAFYFESNE